MKQANARETRAKRLRYLREEVLRLTRAEMAKKFRGVTEASLQNWEYAQYVGLSERGAILISNGCETFGINCSVEWLMHGIGEPPGELLTKKKKITEISSSEAESEEAKIIKELKFFYSLNPDSIDTIVNDNTMNPCFYLGDHVAGKRYFNEEISKALDKPSIIQLKTGELLVRVLKKESDDTYLAINTIKKGAGKKLEKTQILSVAPILWIRRDFS